MLYHCGLPESRAFRFPVIDNTNMAVQTSEVEATLAPLAIEPYKGVW